MSLSVTQLCISRSGRDIVTDLSFSCAPGEAIILRGPNGIGKTTLLRTLAGFIRPKSGEITLQGAGQHDRDAYEDDLIFAGHADAIKAQLTVWENIAFWAALYGNADPARALESVDLTAQKDRLAGQCSAGQKRRLGLARLLVADRSLWLLDEPTVALDTSAKARLSDILSAHLAGDGMALIATHDEDLVAARTLTLSKPEAPAQSLWLDEA